MVLMWKGGVEGSLCGKWCGCRNWWVGGAFYSEETDGEG